MVLEAGKSEIRVPAQSGSSGGSLPNLQVAVFLLYSHVMVRESTLPSVSYKGTTPITGLHPHDLIQN